MGLKTFLPIIVMILLKILSILSETADLIKVDFVNDYNDSLCGRRDAYLKNLDDSTRFLAERFPYLQSQGFDAEDHAGPMPSGCDESRYAVLRELNDSLPAVYPNWLSRVLP